jgi:hypothetical protein
MFEREATPFAWDVRVHALGNGHTEAITLPRHAWREVEPPSALALADYEKCKGGFMVRAGEWVPYEATKADQERDAAENRKRATRRARTKVRRLCKAKGLDTLLTLTYRENMVDRERMARDLDVFLKRVRRVIPDFEYVCAFERQKRGAWHAHLATRRINYHYQVKGVLVKSYSLLRSMWREVVGHDNGNVDVSRNRSVSRSSAKLASYLSKYIGKSFDAAARHQNSYSASGRALPDAIVERILSPNAGDACDALCELLASELATQKLDTFLLDGGGVYFCLSPPPR